MKVLNVKNPISNRHVISLDCKSREEEVRCEVGGEYNSRVAASSCASSFLVRRRDRGQQGREYSMPSRADNNEYAGHKQRNWKEGKI